jgi:FKBP-type peptidyl-prolyl cis-trans isomerase
MRSLYFLLVSVLYFSCSAPPKNEEAKKYNMWNENLITANKYLIKEDAERIDNYIKRRAWKISDGEGGLKYMVFSSDGGDSISSTPKFSMHYRVELLDGTICYDDEKEMSYPSGEMDAGLNRTFGKFCHNDSLVLILPPHYAKGLIGDLDKIPPHSVVVYYVRIK